MKKMLFAFVVMCIALLPNLVYASGFELKDGYVISEADYNKLRKLYTDLYISTMTETDYYRVMTKGIDFDNITTQEAFVKTTYNKMTGEITDVLVTEEEYNNVSEQDVTPRATEGVYETGYKRIVLSFAKTSSQYMYFVFANNWKIMPEVRSFDVIAARFINCEHINGTQIGHQQYIIDGIPYDITYAWNGTNINNQPNGFGISMNLVNDTSITALQSSIEATLEYSELPAGGYGSYQHATMDVSLAASRTYTLGSGGYGSVIKFEGNVGNAYDGMQGVYAYVS